MNNKPVKAILFDIDDTLYDQRKPFEDAIEKHFPQVRAQHVDMNRLFTLSRKYSDVVFEASCKGEITMEEMYTFRIKMALRDVGIDVSDADALACHYSYAENQKHIFMTGTVRDMLIMLAENRTLKLGVITNGAREHQMGKAVTLGLTDLIPEDYILTSGEVGCSKPDPAIFRYAIEKMRLKPEETLYVGDSVINDVQGAAGVGFRTMWFNRRKNFCPEDVHPDYVVTTEEEMCGMLLEISGEGQKTGR